MDDEPMAVVRWAFQSERVPDAKIEGSHTVRTVTEARKIVEMMNSDYGDGTHWVEPLNHTWAETHPT